MHDEFDNCEIDESPKYKVGCYHEETGATAKGACGQSNRHIALAEIRGFDLPPEVVALIEKKNPWDVRLHGIAKHIFTERVGFMSKVTGRDFVRFLKKNRQMDKV